MYYKLFSIVEKLLYIENKVIILKKESSKMIYIS